MLNSIASSLIFIFLSVQTLLNVLVVTYIIYHLQTNNQYKYLSIFFLLIILIFVNFYHELQLYLLVFLLLTELTSLYLILIITLNVNYFKLTSVRFLWVLPLLLCLGNTVEILKYTYFDFYGVSYTNNFNQFFFLFNSQYFLWVINLIFFLTILVLFILTPVSKTQKQNIFDIFSTLVSFVNQVPLNLNLFTNPVILKWS